MKNTKRFYGKNNMFFFAQAGEDFRMKKSANDYHSPVIKAHWVH